MKATYDAIRKALRVWAPPPKLTVSQWADAERRLSAEASAEPGRWVTSRAEYQRGIMDAVGDPTVHSVVVMSSAQVGKTEIINNVVGFYVDQDPAPMLLIQPTEKMGEAWSKDRLAPMIRDTPALTDKVKDPRARDSGNTLLHKTFAGGHITIAGANAPAGLASRPVRVVMCDEVDRYPVSAGAEGDPVNLAKKRSTTFWNRKLILTSTPTVKDASRIEAAYESSDQRRFFVPCPECGVFHPLQWAHVIWVEDNPRGAEYACPECGSLWSDVRRWAAIRRGEWRATAAFNGTAGFHLNEIYSPWVTLGDMAENFVEAKKLPETLKTFINTSLGETWEEESEGVEGDGLIQRREDYTIDPIPMGVAVITAGVDTQDDRLEAELVGWGVDGESWSLGYEVFPGDPAQMEVWTSLDGWLLKRYTHESGVELGVAAACVDSGGHHTSAVYDYTRGKSVRRVWAIKGMAGTGRPVMGRPSRNNMGRVPLYSVGVDTAKDLIYSRLRIADAGPGFCHFPASEEYDEEYFAQLTAEKIVTRYIKGFPTRSWVKARARNEALDCRVYALAALMGLNANIERLAKRLVKKAEAENVETDAEELPPEVETAPPRRKFPQRNKRRRGGFVKNW